MISFKLFFESVQTPPIVPQDIFTFYYLSLVKNSIDLSSEEDKAILLNFFNTLKLKYLNTFTKVIKDQIAKYIRYTQGGRNRIKASSELRNMNPDEFVKTSVIDYDKLETYMKETTRSSGAENKEWNDLAKWINLLSKKPVTINTIKADGENLTFIFDRINNCVHNTGQSIFDKLKENGPALIQAFDQAHIVKSSSALKGKAYSDIRNLPISTEILGNTPKSNISKIEKEFAPAPSFYKRSGD